MNGFWFTDEQQAIRDAVLKLCERFDAAYWRQTDESGVFPDAFLDAMTEAGWLGAAMPAELGGSGLGLTEAAIVMQAVAESGAGFSGASAMHLNIFGPMPVVKFGSEAQKRSAIPRLISGQDRMCFGVTEPDAGLDTTSLTTRAERTNDGYVIRGRKMWTSNAQRANKILIIARTTPKDQVRKATEGLSLFYTDFDRSRITATVIPKMGRKAVESNAVFIDDLHVPAEDLVGEEGRGFYYLLEGLNPERVLIAVEAVGLGRARRCRARRTTPRSASCSAGRSVRTRASRIRWPSPGPNWRRRTCWPSRRPLCMTPAAIAAPRPMRPSIWARKRDSTRVRRRCSATAAWATPRSSTLSATSENR